MGRRVSSQSKAIRVSRGVTSANFRFSILTKNQKKWEKINFVHGGKQILILSSGNGKESKIERLENLRLVGIGDCEPFFTKISTKNVFNLD